MVLATPDSSTLAALVFSVPPPILLFEKSMGSLVRGAPRANLTLGS